MKTSKRLLPVVIAVLAVSMTISAISAAPNVDAQEVTPFPSREKLISVTGLATASVEPDRLNISFGVETQEKTAQLALSSNSELMNTVIDSIKQTGISEDEIATSSFNIRPIYEHYEDKETGRWTQELIGYQVSNIIRVETAKLDSAASIIDNAVSAGINRVDNVSFSLSTESHNKLKDELLEKAVLNAKSKAQKALSPLDHKIIGVKSISLNEFSVPYPTPMFKGDFAMAESAMAAPSPIFSSDQDVSTTANVVFIIGSN